MHRIEGASGIAVDVLQAERDLALLANWELSRNSELAEQGM
jgi:hypothetical protein